MREGHLRTLNKTLKEEVRKLHQKQGGPGSPTPQTPGAPFTPGGNYPQTPGGPGANSVHQTPYQHAHNNSLSGRVTSPGSTPPGTPHFGRILQQQQQQLSSQDDEVNVEYLKNVLLNFMEHKDRRVRAFCPCFFF